MMARLRPLALCSLLALSACVASANAASATLVADGKARCCVVVSAEKAFKEPALFNWAPRAKLLTWAAENSAQCPSPRRISALT